MSWDQVPPEVMEEMRSQAKDFDWRETERLRGSGMSEHNDRMDTEMSELMRDHLIAEGVHPVEVARASDAMVLARLDEEHPGGAWAFVEEHGGEVIQVQTVQA